jgi:hypothetical protein
MRKLGLALVAIASLLVAASGAVAADQISEQGPPVKAALLTGNWSASVQPVHWRWYGGYRPYYAVTPGYASYGYYPVVPYTTYYGSYAPYAPYNYGPYPYRVPYWGGPWVYRRW